MTDLVHKKLLLGSIQLDHSSGENHGDDLLAYLRRSKIESGCRLLYQERPTWRINSIRHNGQRNAAYSYRRLKLIEIKFRLTSTVFN